MKQGIAPAVAVIVILVVIIVVVAVGYFAVLRPTAPGEDDVVAPMDDMTGEEPSNMEAMGAAGGDVPTDEPMGGEPEVMETGG